MGFSSVMQWWNLWQLQIYVLASLGIQYLLVILGALRRRRIPNLLRFFTWISFVSSDSMVLSALGVLFWKLYTSSSAQGSNDLEVFWASILLMHLGGQMCITAYKLEDNEVWTGQILILSSKVTAIMCVFYNLWSPSADNRLLVAAILLLISGIIKCINKIINLKSSSLSSLSTTVNDAPRSTSKQPGLEEYVRQSRIVFTTSISGGSTTLPPIMPLHSAEKLFVDYAHSYSDRLDNLTSFWALDHSQMYVVIRSGLATTFELLYTKSHAPLLIDYLFLVTWATSAGLPIVAIGLFHSIDKQAYRGADVIVTLLLLYGTLALEFICVYLAIRSSGEWPDMVAQHSLFGFFAHNKRYSKSMRFARFLHCKDFLDRYWCMDACHSSEDITAVARKYINSVWTYDIKDGQSYMDHIYSRGQCTLKDTDFLPLLGWSVDKPFDESVLLWHIATEFFFHSNRNHAAGTRCRQMSNYMVHLLFANPEMLLPGSRKSLFTDAYNQLSDILSGEDTCDDADELVQKIIVKLESRKVPEGSIIHNAWLIAEKFKTRGCFSRGDVITWVWVEMLCFSAGSCGGYLHAKSLGSGGEFLSVVSLLLAYSGMPTLPARNQDAPFGYSSSSVSGHGGQGTSTTAASASGPRRRRHQKSPLPLHPVPGGKAVPATFRGTAASAWKRLGESPNPIPAWKRLGVSPNPIPAWKRLGESPNPIPAWRRRHQNPGGEGATAASTWRRRHQNPGGEGATAASTWRRRHQNPGGEGATAASASGLGGEGTTAELEQVVVVPSHS